MSYFQDPMAPKVPGVLGMSNTAAAMSEAGLGPRVGGGAPASPWVPQQVPSFMQQQVPSYMQPQAQPAAAPGFWPSWLSPGPAAPSAAPEPVAPAGPNMGIPGAMQAMAGGAPAWALQMLFGGYA